MPDITKHDLTKRTKEFALRVINLTNALPGSSAGSVLGKQLLRAATSVGANYRAALRARSKRDFANKIGVVLEESDESCYWMELIVEANILPEARVSELLREANELTAIFAATHKTAKASIQNKPTRSETPNLKS